MKTTTLVVGAVSAVGLGFVLGFVVPTLLSSKDNLSVISGLGILLALSLAASVTANHFINKAKKS